jgi:alkylhydroperoxidase family enzyme
MELPTWARTLARPLPRTTLAMLTLDELHRARNPLGPLLAGKLRYVAAQTLGCEYARRYAESDLRLCGLTPETIRALDDACTWRKPNLLALALARKLTAAAHTVTDEEFAEVLSAYGPERTVAIVHTVAFANFHNRILLALDVKLEANEPLPPRAPAPGSMLTGPPRPWSALNDNPVSLAATKPAWDDLPFTTIEEKLASQMRRSSRIALPDLQRFASLPPPAKRQAEKIAWMTVSMGYQPVMTKSWFDALSAFRADTTLDRVLANSIFWVITRTNECFY